LSIIKKIGEVDIEMLLLEINKKEFKSQLPLQGATENDFKGSVGNIWNLEHEEDSYIIPLYKDMPYTYSLIEKYKMKRSRVMKMSEKQCYSYHYDLTPRIHIPLETNEDCMFIFDDRVFRMPADGSVYWVNTMLKHTAINANRNKFERVHIIGNIHV
jgi:hypothetical protein